MDVHTVPVIELIHAAREYHEKFEALEAHVKQLQPLAVKLGKLLTAASSALEKNNINFLEITSKSSNTISDALDTQQTVSAILSTHIIPSKIETSLTWSDYFPEAKEVTEEQFENTNNVANWPFASILSFRELVNSTGILPQSGLNIHSAHQSMIKSSISLASESILTKKPSFLPRKDTVLTLKPTHQIVDHFKQKSRLQVDLA
ncbi:hypothetical protein BCR33DRAFT_493458 [Rhizoclosmatium globosum]|uniref:Uncharacterized protein n=1 Tax=Rhizoclosmatium globosum TaxID=329046 RepID=A0A1Y2CV26_9FUNG|nr:hypothetical protein BCR33DRAFT_493458 [Rhizoclosmatium globosum]|eukprot:ORY50736.1 hypothetical protein BCR33DRAFT_493458 [Rhizoclosmatium globosum]